MPKLFEGEKTSLFWAGLLVLGLTSVVLFVVIWNIQNYTDTILVFESGSLVPVQVGLSFNLCMQIILPWVVGGVVFILIGFYMVKSGVKRGQLPKQK